MQAGQAVIKFTLSQGLFSVVQNEVRTDLRSDWSQTLVLCPTTRTYYRLGWFVVRSFVGWYWNLGWLNKILPRGMCQSLQSVQVSSSQPGAQN